MDVPIASRRRIWDLGIWSIALAATLLAAPQNAADRSSEEATDVAVKAALLLNFAKFSTWPAIAAGVPIIACIVGDDAIAVALAQVAGGQNISGHRIDIWRPDDSIWPLCQLLFLAGAEIRRSSAGLAALRTLPVLTVSDGKGFAQSDGIVELYLENGRRRFAINVDAAERSGVHLSARLLGLARIIRNKNAQ